MNHETEEQLARSLTAETTELLPFLPYLLQDLWALGSNPREMVRLVKRHLPISDGTRILDLACGKGAVSINLAEHLGVQVDGFDLLPDFIEYAKQKAKELRVDALCHFASADVNDIVRTARDYDCVIFGAAGNVLGDPRETLNKLMATVKPGGYILIDDAYLREGLSNHEVKYLNYDYLTHAQWMRLLDDCGLSLVEEAPNADAYDYDEDNQAIQTRANELIAKYPGNRAMFEGYVRSQLNECDDLENNVVGVTWMLQKP